MEFKKKTIIWEDNNEPPKDYIGAKKDGKFYEYSYATRSGVESKSISGGSSSSGGGGEGGDSASMIDAISNFSIKIKKDKSGFFSSTGEPVSGDVYADPYYTLGHQPESLGELTPIEEYFDISDMDVFVGLCNFVKSNDSINTSYDSHYENEVRLQLSESDFLGRNSEKGYISICRTIDYNQEEGDHRDECVCVYHGEYGSASAYFPAIYIFLDPSDPTKFYAKSQAPTDPNK